MLGQARRQGDHPDQGGYQSDRAGVRPARDRRLDAFDRRLRYTLMLACALGSVMDLVIANTPGWNMGFNRAGANALAIVGLLSSLAMRFLPWQRYGRDLFTLITPYTAVLAAATVAVTGGDASPFAPCFFLIVIWAGLYHTPAVATVVAGSCAILGFLPLLYSTPGEGFVLRQVFLGVSYLSGVWAQHLVASELFRRARAERVLEVDLSETRRLRDELARQATTDELTGLYNNRALLARTDDELARAVGGGLPLSVLFFDIDRFKGINDTHGHHAGDVVLADLALRARDALRAGDILGRYGGEEFVALLPGTDRAAAVAVAERLRVGVGDRPFPLPDGTPLAVTISVGVATYPGDARERETLLGAADAALYRAKRGGRDRVCVAEAAVARELVVA